MKKKCNYCYQTFDDEDRIFCPFCGEILNPELKLAADFQKIHEEYQESQKRDAIESKLQEKAVPTPRIGKSSVRSNKRKSEKKKKQPLQSKKTTMVQKNKKKSAPTQPPAVILAVILLALVTVFFLFFQ